MSIEYISYMDIWQVSRKSFRFLVIAISLFFVFAAAYMFFTKPEGLVETCPQLFLKYRGNWSKIQTLYESDTVQWARLDRGKNGVACENYKNKK